jgi:RNA polymerase sigma factor (sigma-70 family)
MPLTPEGASRQRERAERDRRWLADIAARGAGFDSAMRALTEAYNPKFMKALARGLRADQVEDALQEVWIAVVSKAGTYDAERATPEAWLWGYVCRQREKTTSTYGRERSRMVFGDVEQEADSGEDLEGAGSEATPGEPPPTAAPARDFLLMNWLRRCVGEAMAKLRSTDKEGAMLIWLRVSEDWTPEELASAVGKRTGSVKNVLVQARKAARDLLEPCERKRREHQ